MCPTYGGSVCGASAGTVVLGTLLLIRGPCCCCCCCCHYCEISLCAILYAKLSSSFYDILAVTAANMRILLFPPKKLQRTASGQQYLSTRLFGACRSEGVSQYGSYLITRSRSEQHVKRERERTKNPLRHINGTD